ncbi:hypothetical protein PNOK_0145800 [Pyrrhoderma noxium]|uniref:Uncharacterized protein n=1 Tax=Pyrrhoderma noxium TaxID=2282107 RepID=A0A286UXR6_9AGAM|nr:hypothetical protein PNOK_0145800 [Pyrrhoderma noxium]
MNSVAMASQTFTPSDAIDVNKEKDWAANIGMMDWDSTSIVFTKRSLIEFLKYTGITVDTNFTNISKLPRYAKFGKISGSVTQTSGDFSATSAGNEASTDSSFRPTRKVRTVPGGPSSGLFEEEFPDDALSQAPSQSKVSEEPSNVTSSEENEKADDEPPNYGGIRPSRRVRTIPGGKDSIGALLGGDEEQEFKPTRRVRQRPGGQDNIEGIFGPL